MGMIRLRESCFFDAVAIEFAVALSSDGAGCPHDRLSLLRRMARCDVAHDLELVRENEFNATARQRAEAERAAHTTGAGCVAQLLELED